MQATVEIETAGDPCRAGKWIRQSLRRIKATLAGIGFLLSHTSIRRLLKQQGYSLKSNRKSVAMTQHPDRDPQFRYIRRVKQRFIQSGHPVISVDTKKKELISNPADCPQLLYCLCPPVKVRETSNALCLAQQDPAPLRSDFFKLI